MDTDNLCTTERAGDTDTMSQRALALQSLTSLLYYLTTAIFKIQCSDSKKIEALASYSKGNLKGSNEPPTPTTNCSPGISALSENLLLV